MTEPVGALATALHDPERWVRIGAAKSAPYLAPQAASALLREYASAISVEDAPEEAAIVAVALARSRARDDALPVVCKLLNDTQGSLMSVLETRQGARWVDHVSEQFRKAKLPASASNLLTPFLVAWYTSEQESGYHVWTDKERATDAVNSLERDWQSYRRNPLEAEPNITFASAIEKFREGNLTAGSKLLAEAALSDPNESTRFLIRRTLPRLGSLAASPLLSALIGHPDVLPDQAVFASVAREEYSPAVQVSPEALCAYLATNALAEFTDQPTVRAITSGALTWDDEPQARACLVLAQMSTSAALPHLTWLAANLPEASDRSLAKRLLRRIIKDPQYFGIRSHHVHHTEISARSLNWLTTVAARAPSGRNWFADPEVTCAVLSCAIETIPDIFGPLGRAYMVRDSMSSYLRYILRFGFSGDDQVTTTSLRHPWVSFPTRCRKGENVTLKVRLLPSQADGTRAPFDVPFMAGQMTTNLIVLVHASGFMVSEPYGILHVPRDGASDTATFNLRARDDGMQVIDIKFLLGATEIGHCYVDSEIGATNSSDLAETVALETMSEASLERRSGAHATIIVHTSEDGYLDWQILEQVGEPRPLGRSPICFNSQQVETWAERQSAVVRNALAANLSAAELAGVLANLAGIGVELFNQLSAPALADELAKMPNDAIIVIASDADWIPWELLTTGANDRLLGDRFVLVRSALLRKPPKKAASVPRHLSSTIERALLVVGDQISGPLRLHEVLFGAYAARANPPLVEQSWPVLCESVEGKDIVHFACHGRTGPQGYYLSFGSKPGSQLVPGQVEALKLKPGALVFANACSSGRARLVLAEFQSFGRAFYLIGARPFIGTLGPVPEDDAVEFATLFYRYFACEGLPAGHAMRLARRDAAKKLKAPTWLFYCLYGNAAVTRRWSPAM